MHQELIETKQKKDNNETLTLMVHGGQINETTTLILPTEEERRQNTSEDHDLGYIKRILSSPEETLIDPKEFINKGYVNPFSKDVWSCTMA